MTMDIISLQILVSFIVFVLAAAGLTTGWLTSPWFENDRNWLLGLNNKFSTLAVCALCSGFWFALATEWIFLPYLGILLYVGFALASAFTSWLLYSIGLAAAWIVANLKE